MSALSSSKDKSTSRLAQNVGHQRDYRKKNARSTLEFSGAPVERFRALRQNLSNDTALCQMMDALEVLRARSLKSPPKSLKQKSLAKTAIQAEQQNPISVVESSSSIVDRQDTKISATPSSSNAPMNIETETPSGDARKAPTKTAKLAPDNQLCLF